MHITPYARAPRKTVFGALAVAATAAAIIPAAADANAPQLTLRNARAASMLVAGEVAQPFTEREPQIHAACRRVTRTRARCSVRIRGDRIDARLASTVRRVGDDYVVYFARLQTRRLPGEEPSS